MTTSLVPQLLDAVVTAARAAIPGLSVYDGYGTTDDPGDFLMVGVDDPVSPTAAFSAQAQQSVATMGTTRSRDETGTINCAAYSWNGDADQQAARNAAYATLAAVETLLRTDPSLSLQAGGYFVAQIESQRLSQAQGGFGADALLLFSIRFRARL